MQLLGAGHVKIARLFYRAGPRISDRGQSCACAVESAAERLARRAQTGEILSIESAKRGFDGWADANNSFFDARSEECDPKLTSKK